MGSYTELYIDDYPVLSSKSYVDGEVMTIFSESDKKTYKRRISERNKLIWGECSENDDQDEIAHEYTTNVAYAIDRLEVMGFTLHKTNEELNSSVKEYLQMYKENVSGTLEEFQKSEIALLESISIEDFIIAFKELREKQVPLGSYVNTEEFGLSDLGAYLINGSGWMFNYPGNDIRCYLRVLLESCRSDSTVTQDITEITNAGYYDLDDYVRNIEVENLTCDYEVNSKIIILTEGTSDKAIIERSLSLLYPHLSCFYSLMDFGTANAAGGAKSLVAQIKGFVGAGIKNRVVAIFDNDTAAFVAKKALDKTKIPKNISVIHYPDFPLAENYPTHGPTGKQSINVNGLSGSIEMYLGQDILRDNDELVPVQWRGYDTTLKKYQGEVMNKPLIQKRFYEKLDDCERNPDNITKYDWVGMKLILNEIFNSFKS